MRKRVNIEKYKYLIYSLLFLDLRTQAKRQIYRLVYTVLV